MKNYRSGSILIIWSWCTLHTMLFPFYPHIIGLLSPYPWVLDQRSLSLTFKITKVSSESQIHSPNQALTLTLKGHMRLLGLLLFAQYRTTTLVSRDSNSREEDKIVLLVPKRTPLPPHPPTKVGQFRFRGRYSQSIRRLRLHSHQTDYSVEVRV